MLQGFRKHKRWMMALIIGPISIAFVATGIYSYSRSNEGDKALAEVGGSKITPEEFDQTKRQELQQLQQQMGSNFKSSILDNQQARAALDGMGITYRVGSVATGDWFGIPGQRADWVRDTFHPLLCEMEGGAAAQVCYRCGVPFMALKSVSDCLTSKHDYNFNFPTAMRDLNAAVMALVDHLED
mgnify:CR=1 FL=1